MSDMKLRRGVKEVVFHKIYYKFAVRFKYGSVINENTLKSHCGSFGVRSEYLGSLGAAKMHVFEVDDETKLDHVMDVLRTCPRVDVVSHIYKLDESAASEVIPTGIMTIQFSPNVPIKEKEKILNEFSLELLENLDFLPDGHIIKLSKEAKENPLKIAAKLQQKREIMAADPDIIFRVAFHYQPLESLFKMQWHLKSQGDLLCCAKGADVSAEEAWNYTKGSRDIVMCFIDHGFDLSHPKFNANEKIVYPKDFSDNRLSQDSFLIDSHGTACAGLALAEENGTGTVGLAPNCAFMPIELPFEISDNTFLAMFSYAMSHKADIICCGWGAEAMYFPLSTAMNAIIHKAATEGRKNGKGCVILFAAGNDNSPLDGTKGGSQWLNLKSGTRSLNGFAIHPDVIAVGASNSLDKRATYSNYGDEL
jgi:subtilisin family serine protease